MRWLRGFLYSLLAVGLVVALIAAGAVGWLHWKARDGEPPFRGRPTAAVRAPVEAIPAGEPQILFGDLHVHTSYSADALTYSLPLFQGEGAHPPADACDFARFCSGLDFWSINDHAEQLTAAHWSETQQAIRECNEIAGNPEAPDLVSFLGWEWSQTGLSPETHFGHRNVVLLDTMEDAVPTRPITAGTGFASLGWGWIGLALSLADPGETPPDFYRYLLDNRRQEICAEGVDVRELPPGCKEGASTPQVLFEKLEQWGFPSVVIPHGLAWGTTNPAGATLEGQLGEQHDPTRQQLLEVYSGHGSSERYADIAHVTVSETGERSCPQPSKDFEPCCFRAGEIIRSRCDDPESETCEASVLEAQLAAVEPFALSFGASIEDTTLEDWGDCGQLRLGTQAAYNYRPRQSAQMSLALKKGEGDNGRFRFGFLGSSDNHRGRPGTGYKEFGPSAMTDGMRPQPAWSKGSRVEPILAPRRADSFYFTGGLVAVHTTSRDRGAIFNALKSRHVYGTTGPRMQLWFDAVEEDGARHVMGSELSARGPLRFEVRASGAREQLPGCPETVWDRLGPERTQSLCLSECHHPGDQRHPITRIEVVRIRPQLDESEPIASLIDDPWKSFACPADGGGCQIEFVDPDLAQTDREHIYYVRALQAPTLALNGGTLRCERDASGSCIQAHPCRPPPVGEPWSDDCMSPIEEQAFSSPIFVGPGA